MEYKINIGKFVLVNKIFILNKLKPEQEKYIQLVELPKMIRLLE